MPDIALIDWGDSLQTSEKIASTLYGFTLRSGSDGSSYHADTVDFFALVILPLYTIYIVPQSALAEKVKAYAYPENPNSAGALERYRENWTLL